MLGRSRWLFALAVCATCKQAPERPVFDFGAYARIAGFEFGKTTEADVRRWLPHEPVARDRTYGGADDVRYDGKPAIHVGVDLATITRDAGYVPANHVYLAGTPPTLVALSVDAFSLCVDLGKKLDDQPRTRECPPAAKVDVAQFESPLWVKPDSIHRWCLRGPAGKGTVLIECRTRDGDDAIFAWLPGVDAP